MKIKNNQRQSLVYLALIFIAAIVVAASERDNERVVSYSSLTNAKYDTLIVAKVGPINISAREFMLSYEYGPAFVKRGKNSKKRFLDFMINEKLLSLDGYAQKLDKRPIVTETLAEIEGDLATEELYKEEVLSQVSVTEAEIEEGIQRKRQHVALKWLYAPTFDGIDALQKRLLTGVPFDSLFAQQLSDSVALEDRFMETTRFKLQTKNPALSTIVDTLTYGKPSSSIGTADGWYIVKIIDLWTNAIVTETEQMKLRYKVNRALFKRKADALSDKYVHEMMLQNDPVIQRRTFNLLRAYIGKRILPPEKFTDWNLTGQLLAEYGPIDSVKIDDYNHKALVKLVHGEVLIKDFLLWYKARQPYIRLSTSSPQSFFVSLEQIIWRMVRDKLLVDKAFQRGFQNREIVKTQKRWWRDKSVYALRKAYLAENIQITEEQIKKYYDQNKEDYRDRNNQTRPFAKVKNDVKKDLTRYEWIKAVLHKILALKAKHEVQINQNVLDALNVDIQNQPNAIDVYTVKKGGTFPRPAYPTIDMDWQAWY